MLTPINQSQLRWIENGNLYNIQYEEGNLVIQIPGWYFIYCHLHFYITRCPSTRQVLKLELFVNESSMKQTLLTLCGSEKTCEGTYHDLFQVLLVQLKKGDLIKVKIEPFEYLNDGVLPQSNVLGALKYSGEEWWIPLVQDSKPKHS